MAIYIVQVVMTERLSVSPAGKESNRFLGVAGVVFSTLCLAMEGPVLCNTPAFRSLRNNPLLVTGGQKSVLMVTSLPAARPCARSSILCGRSPAPPFPVLIQGEIGAGKQTIAREIHRQSPLAARPFVHVACGSLRESDLEEKLFGESWDCFSTRRGRASGPLGAESMRHVIPGRGGATSGLGPSEVAGRFAASNGPKPRRRRLVRGGRSRVIASSTCDLKTAVAENRFYSRLYYYLNCLRIDIPPLRHRQEDIRALAEHFLAAAASEFRAARTEASAVFFRGSVAVSACSSTGRAMSCNWPR